MAYYADRLVSCAHCAAVKPWQTQKPIMLENHNLDVDTNQIPPLTLPHQP